MGNNIEDVIINLQNATLTLSQWIHDEKNMYKKYHGISPTIMNEIFILRHQNKYSLKNWTYLDVPKVRTDNYGSEQPPEVFYQKRCS